MRISTSAKYPIARLHDGTGMGEIKLRIKQSNCDLNGEKVRAINPSECHGSAAMRIYQIQSQIGAHLQIATDPQPSPAPAPLPLPRPLFNFSPSYRFPLFPVAGFAEIRIEY